MHLEQGGELSRHLHWLPKARLDYCRFGICLPQPKHNNLPPSTFGNDSRLRLALAAQKKHTTRKYNISAREPGGTDVILVRFFFSSLHALHMARNCLEVSIQYSIYLRRDL